MISYVEGGMGGVSKALAGAAVEAGATLVTEVEVINFYTLHFVCSSFVSGGS